jgi:nitrite reductase/ring-hydroxylating ferredoxin subunit
MLPSAPGEFIFGMDQEVLRCPWHKMEFSLLTGESLFDTSDFKVFVYEVEIVGDEVWVESRRSASASQRRVE